MANAKDASFATKLQRAQVAEAVTQGFLDSALASDLSTAKSNGYAADRTADAHVDISPIAGVNR